jgi:hypothetical protein
MIVASMPRRGTPWLALRQLLVVGALGGVISLMAMVHLAALARPLYVVGALGLGLFYKRRSPWAFLTLTLWFWSVSPFVRRVVDYYGGHVTANPILLAGNAMALLMLKDVMSSRRTWWQPEARWGLLALVTLCYGLGVSFVRGEILGGVIAAADWFPPLFYFFYVIDLWPRIDEAEPHMRAFVPVNLAVVALYGLLQYTSPPIWDTTWMLESNFQTIGVAAAYQLHTFSTLNDAGLCAVWITAMLLLSLAFRTWITTFLLPLGGLILLTTQVRSSMGSFFLGVSIASAMAGARIIRPLIYMAIALMLVVLAIPMLDPKGVDLLTKRLDSFYDLSHDGSAQVREGLYEQIPDLTERNIMGIGIGALGRGAVASGTTEYQSVDSGPLAVALALGVVPGTFYFLAFFGATGQALLAAQRTKSLPAIALATTALAGSSVIVFTYLVGLMGMLIWMSAGYAIAIGIKARSEQTSAVQRARPLASLPHATARPEPLPRG